VTALSLTKSQLSVVENCGNRTAFLVGNGINYGIPEFKDWRILLCSLADDKNRQSKWPLDLEDLCQETDITYPEIYDLLWFNTKKTDSKSINHHIKQSLADKLSKWMPSSKHFALLSYCKARGIPVLTTNYDLTLETASKLLPKPGRNNTSEKNEIHCDGSVAELIKSSVSGLNKIRYRHNNKMSGDWYKNIPDSDTFLWKQYYSDDNTFSFVEKDINQYSIWHIHGRVNKPMSIRIGLNDYVELLTKLKAYKTSAFFENQNCQQEEYVTTYSWMDYFFMSDLVIFGLGLNQAEVGLRWLLMERSRYLRIVDNKLTTLFIHGQGSNEGTIKLLSNMGIKCISDPEHKVYDYFMKCAVSDERIAQSRNRRRSC
jgi:hypothetical protein